MYLLSINVNLSSDVFEVKDDELFAILDTPFIKVGSSGLNIYY